MVRQMDRRRSPETFDERNHRLALNHDLVRRAQAVAEHEPVAAAATLVLRLLGAGTQVVDEPAAAQPREADQRPLVVDEVQGQRREVQDRAPLAAQHTGIQAHESRHVFDVLAPPRRRRVRIRQRDNVQPEAAQGGDVAPVARLIAAARGLPGFGDGAAEIDARQAPRRCVGPPRGGRPGRRRDIAVGACPQEAPGRSRGALHRTTHAAAVMRRRAARPPPHPCSPYCAAGRLAAC